MSELSWDKIEEIFSKAVEVSETAQRDKFLREACGTDETLRRKILSLLNADQKADKYLEAPLPLPPSLSNLFPNSGFPTLSGQTVGAYQILKRIGAGGMGTVYLAKRADGEFEKKAAVKIIKQGLASDFNQRRFRRERQILAALEHPFIAGLLDGGTTSDGLPYLIMEFIEGQTLPDYCRSQNLNIKARLKLFLEVCEAVEYAHQQKIIHRDIKPSNILVTANGIPKLLDFGIAKILDADLIHDSASPTATFLQQLTPEYASPEQIKNEQITAASDIYSMGILLYELIAGKRPYHFKNRSPYEIAQVICEQEIPPMKTLIGNSSEKVHPDLERIILKALQKEPKNRYRSVTEFAADIEHYIMGETVLAETPTNHFGKSRFRENPVGSAKSIAILPLKLLNVKNAADGQPLDENYLGIGLADVLTTRLSMLRQLAVRPTSSVLRVAEHSADSYSLGRELGVNYVLDGHILRINSQIRITVQLLQISDNSVVWASQFDENEIDIFRLQDSIAEKTVASLLPQLTTEELKIPGNYGTTNAEAYEAYLRGRFYWNNYTAEGIAKSEKYFKRAISFDPKFALAYAGLADFYNWRGVAEITLPADSFVLAKESARQAIELDENLAEAYASLGFATWAYDWNSEKAEYLYQRSIKLNPNYAKSHEWYAYLLSSAGQHNEACRKMEQAEKLDPNSLAITAMFGFVLYNARRYEEALAKTLHAIELGPDHYLPLQGLGWVCPPLGKFEQGIEGCRQAVAISDVISFNKTSLLLALADAGDRAEAEQLALEIAARRNGEHLPAYFLALIFTSLGETEKAFEWLDTAIKERGYWTQWLRVEPRLDVLRKDARFIEYEKRISPIIEENITDKIEFLTTSQKTADQADDSKIDSSRHSLSKKSRVLTAVAGLVLIIMLSSIFIAFRNITLPPPSLVQIPASKTLNTLVILPFADETGNRILSSGLAEQLKSNLGRFKKLSVLSVGNQQNTANIKDLRRELNADFILRGTFQKSADTFGSSPQLTAELINAVNNETLWKEKFAAETSELPRLQGQISERVLNVLSVELSSGEREFVAKPYTQDSEAFQLYLAGRYHLIDRTKEGFDKAIANFTRAAQRDPNFALAYSGLADTYLIAAQTNSQSKTAFYEKAEKHALKALSLDEDLAEAQTSLAMTKYEKDSDFTNAELHFRRSIEINPSFATAHHWFALMLQKIGRTEEAIKEIQTAAELEPRSLIINKAAGIIYCNAGRFDEAYASFEKVIEINKNSPDAYLYKSYIQQIKGNYRGAIETFRNASIYGNRPEDEVILSLMAAQIQASEGENEKAISLLNEVFQNQIFIKESANFSTDVALVYYLSGDREKTFEWLDKWRKSPGFVPGQSKDARFDLLNSDPRFIEIMN